MVETTRISVLTGKAVLRIASTALHCLDLAAPELYLKIIGLLIQT